MEWQKDNNLLYRFPCVPYRHFTHSRIGVPTYPWGESDKTFFVQMECGECACLQWAFQPIQVINRVHKREGWGWGI